MMPFSTPEPSCLSSRSRLEQEALDIGVAMAYYRKEDLPRRSCLPYRCKARPTLVFGLPRCVSRIHPMAWRFLVACVALTAAFGLSIGAEAQDDAKAAKPEVKEKAAPVAAKSAPSKAKSKRKGSSSRARGSESESSTPPGSRTELATFGAGCFWHVEARVRAAPRRHLGGVGLCRRQRSLPVLRDGPRG